MNIERGNVRNQFFVSSDLMSLYAATKVLSQIRPPRLGALPPALFACKLEFGLENFKKLNPEIHLIQN